MNEEAQNAILKNLEEPPEGVILFFALPPGKIKRDYKIKMLEYSFSATHK